MEQFEWFAGIFLAFSLVFLASLYFKYNKKLRKRDMKEAGCPVHGKESNEEFKTEHDIDNLSKLLDIQPDNETIINQAFEIALEILKVLPKNVAISSENQLELYGLFKQANIGNINKSEPSKLYYAQHAKWTSWNKHKGKTKLMAKKQYFKFVYNQIIKTFNLNVKLLLSSTSSENQTKNRGGVSMNFAVNSKIEQFEFNEELHGDPNELFNAFDLTKDINEIDKINEYILKNKININKQNENGTTFLNFAVDNNKYELSELLIDKFKANVNLSDDMGYTPLHCAAMNGNKEIITLLLDNGADINAKSNDDDETPADLAESLDIKQLLSACSD